MTIVRDRRLEPLNDKFGTDKQRFRNRYLKRVQKAIHDKIEEGSLEDFGKGGVRVPVPKETTREPVIHHSQGGDHTHVFPGNISFDVGDRIQKSGGGAGKGAGGNDPGVDDSSDDFIWVNEAELLDILFEGRALPDMSKLQADSITITQREHSGYTNKGPDHRMDMLRTDRRRREDSIVLAKGAERRILSSLVEQFNILAVHQDAVPVIDIAGKPKHERDAAILDVCKSLGLGEGDADAPDLIAALGESVSVLKNDAEGKISHDERHRLKILDGRLSEQFKQQGKTEKFQDRHLTYEYDDDMPRPYAKAVMFCQMDVSASMEQKHKNTAKVFYWLLNKFLKETYEKVDIIYIAHTETAWEADEQEFFHGNKSGGTLVSSCIDKTLDIIKERYPVSEWNIYGAQASDGDNSSSDNKVLTQKMEELLRCAQAHYYVEIGDEHGKQSDLFMTYEDISKRCGRKLHAAAGICSPLDALNAFKRFFPATGAGQSRPYAREFTA